MVILQLFLSLILYWSLYIKFETTHALVYFTHFCCEVHKLAYIQYNDRMVKIFDFMWKVKDLTFNI